MGEGINTLSVVVTYNGEEWIKRCLDSLTNSSIQTDIIVIDNQSSDNTLKIIKSDFPDVDLIEAKENLGFGAANNIGLEKALNNNYDFAFLLNQDAWVQKDTIEHLIKAQQLEDEYGVLSPIHLNKDGSALELLFSQFIAPDKCPNLYSDIYTKNVKSVIYNIKFINAAAWLVSIKCIKTIGGFSPIFYHYGEDNNYCFRVKYHGLKVGILATTEIYHAKESYNSKHENPEVIRERQRLMLYSDPQRYKILDEDIHINKMSAYKSLIKFDFKNYRSFKSKANNLIKLRNRILPFIEASLSQGPNFLSTK